MIFVPSENTDALKKMAAEAAVDYVHDGDTVGLGTGSTARYVVLALAERVKKGLNITGVPTSKETAELARQSGVPLMDRDDSWIITVAIDGADQVDPQLNLIKGGGGALLKEKIVAAAAGRLIIVVDGAKRVPALGHPFPLPVEVVPFGWGNTARHIETLGIKTVIRRQDGRYFETEAGHYILDLQVGRIDDPRALEARLNEIPGVVETGLFVGRTDLLIVGTPNGIEVQKAAK
ncbi:MAG: ribose-5-phosphate isomerase RpiA [Nitrospiraceae bacterium]